MAISKRLMELIQMCREEDTEPEEYDCSNGYFDSDLTFHFDREFPEDTLFFWEWVFYPEVVRYAESLGIQIPDDPPVDLSKTF